jgi:hypothetical protein
MTCSKPLRLFSGWGPDSFFGIAAEIANYSPGMFYHY